jgi:hypothetical protein
LVDKQEYSLAVSMVRWLAGELAVALESMKGKSWVGLKDLYWVKDLAALSALRTVLMLAEVKEVLMVAPLV